VRTCMHASECVLGGMSMPAHMVVHLVHMRARMGTWCKCIHLVHMHARMGVLGDVRMPAPLTPSIRAI